MIFIDRLIMEPKTIAQIGIYQKTDEHNDKYLCSQLKNKYDELASIKILLLSDLTDEDFYNKFCENIYKGLEQKFTDLKFLHIHPGNIGYMNYQAFKDLEGLKKIAKNISIVSDYTIGTRVVESILNLRNNESVKRRGFYYPGR